MKSNMDSLSTIITFGAPIGKVSPVQLVILGMFQSMLYHANRYAVGLLLGGVDEHGRCYCHSRIWRRVKSSPSLSVLL